MKPTNKKLHIYLFCLLLWPMVKLCAQQSTQYTHYTFNQMSFNPAYAGSQETLEGVLIYRDQWSKINGAPVSQSLSIHSPLNNDKVGLGLDIQNDKLGPAKQFYANGNFSYTLQLKQEMQLALGLKAGLKVFDLDFSEGQSSTPNDLAFQNNNTRLTPTLGVGAFLYKPKWYLGLSVLDILSDRYYDVSEENVAKEKVQYFLTGGYIFDLSDNVRFKPAFLGKYLSGFPLVVDVSANFLIYNKFSLGISYRYDDALSGLAGFYFFDGFFAGYSYDYTVSSFNNTNTGGSHELMLSYKLPTEKTIVEFPRYF
ncbi:PorP/SprF family type IX secretion system membrane protein [Croceibacter atlanticus]|jgi:type IX secretion system PorP/SprF family membrane protein|uniref:PorP/SprF family type IX secretion system membrane protein n=1 Tax=Croceibacter atlanticus TaxID=313588 RepID=UPI0024B87C96|nr:type IX secretion system membrane protein PorP/SprF [Croceibacter atlanticus]